MLPKTVSTTRPETPVILGITAFDPCGRTGLGAEIKTAAALGCHMVGGITSMAAAAARQAVPVDVVSLLATLDELAGRYTISAVRLGELCNREIAGAVAEFLEEKRFANVVAGPFFGHCATGAGSKPSTEMAEDALFRRLLRLSSVLTVNLTEAEALTGIATKNAAGRHAAAEKLIEMGTSAVAVTGGQLDPVEDLLLVCREDSTLYEELFTAPRVESQAEQGAGCSFAAALACGLAQKHELAASVFDAQFYIGEALRHALPVSGGAGLLNHLWKLYK